MEPKMYNPNIEPKKNSMESITEDFTADLDETAEDEEYDGPDGADYYDTFQKHAEYDFEDDEDDSDADDAEPIEEEDAPDAWAARFAKEYRDHEEREKQKKAEEKQPNEKQKKELTDEDIEQCAATVRNIHQGQIEEGKFKIGEYLLDEVFDGDIANVISKNPHKDESLEKIVTRSGLEVNVTTLARWIKAAAVRRELIDKKMDVDQLSLSKASALSKVTVTAVRIGMATTVITRGLTVKETDQMVRQFLQQIRKATTEVSLQGKNLNVENLIKRMRKAASIKEDEELANLLSHADLISKTLKDDTEGLKFAREVKILLNNRKNTMTSLDKETHQLQQQKEPLAEDIEFLDDLYKRISSAVLNGESN